MGLAAHGRLYHHVPGLETAARLILGSKAAPASAAPEGPPYERFVEEAATLYGVSADLVRAVIQIESNYNPRAVSRRGARGLMQLTPVTLRELDMKIDPFDPRENILAGTKYLGLLLARHQGNVPLALASYNAGPTAVRRHRGIPPFKETRGYVQKVQTQLAELRAGETTLAD
jgi:soluble lytic murein transglycosylase